MGEKLNSLKNKNLKIKTFLLLLIMFFGLLQCGCNRQQSIILFNNFPITKANLLKNSTEFVAGKRIYYVFITELPLATTQMRVRVLKRDEKANNQAIKLVYSNDFKLYKDQVYYYNDYIVINEGGAYCMEVYAKNDLSAPMAIADFMVKN